MRTLNLKLMNHNHIFEISAETTGWINLIVIKLHAHSIVYHFDSL